LEFFNRETTQFQGFVVVLTHLCANRQTFGSLVLRKLLEQVLFGQFTNFFGKCHQVKFTAILLTTQNTLVDCNTNFCLSLLRLSLRLSAVY
jgi:hypothetical protein